MTISIRKAAITGLASLGAIALLAGCGSAPTDKNTNAPEGASDYKPCMVSDSGGFDDKSFNQSSYEGLQEASAKVGVKAVTVESNKDDDYEPNLSNLVDQGCNTIFAIGFKLEAAVKDAAAANPDVNFVTLDVDGVKAPNVKSVVYDTAQAAFLAGYAAADFSKTGVVGTMGGMKLPTVTIFMDGYSEGVKYYNEKKGKNVQVKGMESFSGGFEANDTAKQVANGLIGQDVDVIMPVGGPIFLSAIAAIKDSKKDIALVGVDTDQFISVAADNGMFLTSVVKEMKKSVYDLVIADSEGKFDATAYVGTLKNEGLALAPFHDYESKVSPTLQAELDTIKAGIIDGSIKATSPSSPK